MHILIKQSVLLNAIQSVGRAVPQKPSHPVLINVKIETDEDHLIFTGFDLSFGIEMRLNDCLIKRHGSACLPAKLLTSIVSKQDSDSEIEMIVDDNFQCTLRCDNVEYQIAGMDVLEYPELLTIDNGSEMNDDDFQEILVNSNDLISSIRNTIFASSQDETKQILVGVNFQINSSQLKVAATDGHRLAVITINPDEELELGENKEGEMTNLTIPAKILKELERILSQIKSESVKLIEGCGSLTFRVKADDISVTLVGRSLYGQYPNYPHLIPPDDKFSTQITIDRKALIKSIDKVSPILDGTKNDLISIDINADNQQIKLITQTQDVGKCFESIPAQISGDLDLICFNIKYLSEGLKTIDSTEVQIKLTDKTNPCIITPLSNLDMLYLVMPVQRRS